jgi:single-strand DNA-binding protein
MTVTTKVCTRCGRELLATAEWFKVDRRTKSGLGSICKSCAASYTRRWYEQKMGSDPTYARHRSEPAPLNVEADAQPEDGSIVGELATTGQGVQEMTWHQTIIVGNLGKDPEMRYLQSGQGVCSFSVAVSERWTDRNSQEKKEKTTWYRVSAWGPLAETCNAYLKKGRQVMVVGTVEARAYTDNSGQPAASLELRARDVRFIGARDGQQGAAGGEVGEYAPQTDDLNDIPF